MCAWKVVPDPLQVSLDVFIPWGGVLEQETEEHLLRHESTEHHLALPLSSF